ncbi:NUDIX domain-containing protein [Herpetosiphon geysericola]|nr:NUDIX domain-containing protein [Herpetosiphon geysericola]
MYCLQCRQRLEPRLRGGRERLSCPDCGWVWFNSAPAGVAAVIQNEVGEVLLVRRAGSFRPGLWCLPCGYLEHDEEMRQALAREVLEETGLHAEIGEVIAVHSNLDREPPYPLGVWLRATVSGGALQAGGDADLAQFFARDQLPPLAFDHDALVLAQLQQPHDASIASLTNEMHEFVRSKGWYEANSKRPQTPRNLAISLTLEAAEVLEHLQWRDEIVDQTEWQGELADVLLYLLQLADTTNVNLVEAVHAKLRKNANRVWDEPAQ